MDNNSLINTLIQSLRLVASPAEVQIASLPDFVVVPEEVALTYNDAYLTAFGLREEKLITSETLEMLKELNILFDKMSGEKKIWTIEKLKDDQSWEESRALALKILKEMNEPCGSPGLDFISWTT